jgi:hypothetical protein
MPVCATLSLADEEKSSAEIDSHTTDHQSDALVCNVFFFYLLPAASELERGK